VSPPDIPTITPLGDRALVLRFGEHIDEMTSARVGAAWRCIANARIQGVIDLVPAYTTLTAHYDWQTLPEDARERPWQWFADEIVDVLSAGRDETNIEARALRPIEIPVCYEAPHAPDLDEVAHETRQSPAEIVHRHSRNRYSVAFLGFRPGFPYLLGLDPALTVARLAEPRTHVPAGSIGLAGRQTGIYPTEGAGGWRLIGRTPLSLFDPRRRSPALLAPGEQVRFVPISAAEFETLTRQIAAQPDEAIASAGEAVFEVVAPGVHTTMQDAGRIGLRHLGVTASGSSDAVARSLANALVGNRPDATVLEMTLRGPTLHLLHATTIALAGRGMIAFADNLPLPFARPVHLAAGCRLSFRPTGDGARSWLAAAGGFLATRWLGSASVDIGSELFGTPLQTGQRVSLAMRQTPTKPVAADTPASFPSWWIDATAEIDSPMILRFIVDSTALPALCNDLAARVWRVSNASDRTGTRLEGTPVDIVAGGARISAGVLHGSIQVPANGLPILLGPDCQTTGGYPVAGHVIEADLPRLAQLKPGDMVWLQPFPLEEAHAERVALSAMMARMRLAIAARLRDALF
jgi:KipI family sensor histidine kinase inhibitor